MFLMMIGSLLTAAFLIAGVSLIILSIRNKRWWFLGLGIVCLAIAVAFCPHEKMEPYELVTAVDRPAKGQPYTFIGKDGGVYRVESVEYMGTNIYRRKYRNLFALGWVDLGTRYSFYKIGE